MHFFSCPPEGSPRMCLASIQNHRSRDRKLPAYNANIYRFLSQFAGSPRNVSPGWSIDFLFVIRWYGIPQLRRSSIKNIISRMLCITININVIDIIIFITIIINIIKININKPGMHSWSVSKVMFIYMILWS